MIYGPIVVAAFASLMPHAVQDRMARPPPIAPPAPPSPVVDPVWPGMWPGRWGRPSWRRPRKRRVGGEGSGHGGGGGGPPLCAVARSARAPLLANLLADRQACSRLARARASSRALGRGAGIESLADGDGEARVMGSVAQTEEDVTRMESSDGVLLFDDEGNDGGGFGSWSRSEALPPERAPPLAPACVLRADALPHQARHSRARASPHGLSIPPAARLSEGDVLWLCLAIRIPTDAQ